MTVKDLGQAKRIAIDKSDTRLSGAFGSNVHLSSQTAFQVRRAEESSKKSDQQIQGKMNLKRIFRNKVELIHVAIACVFVMGAMGCGFTIHHLSEEVVGVPPLSTSPLISLRVEQLSYVGENSTPYTSEVERKLVQSLRASKLFSVVYAPRSRTSDVEPADLILRGEILTHWGSQGLKNFLTYFPGGLVFAPSWRGTRWEVDATANLEIVDARTGARVGSYVVPSAHEMVHKSGNPWHFVGAATVIPGSINGSTRTRVHPNYRDRVYAVAFPELWRRVVARIAEDRASLSMAAVDSQRKACGEDYEAPPVIGKLWEAYRECQSQHFRKTGERQISAGKARVFVDAVRNLRVFVIEGRIAQWDGLAELGRR